MSEQKKIYMAVRWSAAIFVGALGACLAGFFPFLVVVGMTHSEVLGVLAALVSGLPVGGLLAWFVVTRLDVQPRSDHKPAKPVSVLLNLALAIGYLGAAVQVVEGLLGLGSKSGLSKLSFGVLLVVVLTVSLRLQAAQRVAQK